MEKIGIEMGETNRQVENMEYSLEVMFQCKYASWKEDVGVREGGRNNEHTKNNM